MEVHRDQANFLLPGRPERTQQNDYVQFSSPGSKQEYSGIVSQLSQRLYPKKDSTGGTRETLLQKFYELSIVTRRRQGLPPQPVSWFRGLVAAFGEDLKIRVATKDDLPIASILTLTHKKSMVYKYGCSDARFHKFGGMAFLFWHAIQEAKDKGCEEFEMGRSDTDNLGLISFKEHWGTVGTELSYWTYPHSPATTLSVRQKAVLRRLVSLAPDFALKTAGKLLYGHTG
jgi:lipid II:glycine glycyltransferase (peptidoglycan interpeptide bridge formation enzyme)